MDTECIVLYGVNIMKNQKIKMKKTRNWLAVFAFFKNRAGVMQKTKKQKNKANRKETKQKLKEDKK
jgi:hypothetical protein